MGTRTWMLLAMAALAVAACGDGGGDDGSETNGDGASGDQFPRQEVDVAAGEVPPDPEEVGVGDEVEPVESDTLDVDVAGLTSGWNEAAETIGSDGLVVEEWTVGYAQPFGDLSHEFEPWLSTFGGWSYTGGGARYAAVEWGYEPGLDGQLVANAWRALLVAAADVGLEEAEAVLDDLGMVEVTPADLEEGLEATTTLDGVEIEVWSDASGGDLEVRPAE